MGGNHVTDVLEELELWREALEESSYICPWQRKNKGNNYPPISLSSLNILLTPLVCKTQPEARGQESPSGVACRDRPSRALSWKERLTIDGGSQGLQRLVSTELTTLHFTWVLWSPKTVMINSPTILFSKLANLKIPYSKIRPVSILPHDFLQMHKWCR